MYGDEIRGIPPEKLFTQRDAKKAIEYAEFVHEVCSKFLLK